MKVLLVEDHRQMAEQLATGLEGEGYTVSLAYDGQAGLELARILNHDLVILDRMLPKLDGLEVARRLRESRISTPILMLTARDAPSDVVEGLDHGADDYLTKPFAFEVLLARLRALARRGTTASKPVLEVADLCVDPATHRVVRGGQEIKLSHREFQLLLYLVRHAGQVVARSTLIDSVWGYNASIESNTLDAFIHLLRNKVDSSRVGPKLIYTVRGVGYCLSTAPP